MKRSGSIRVFTAAAFAVLAAAQAAAERVQLALPIVVEAATAPASQVYSFRKGQFWGGQPARYRSAVTLEQPVPLPELGSGVALAAGKVLFELEARSRDTSGSFYCTGRPPSKKLLGILCLFDRDRDGRMDELWTAIGFPETLVPLPPATLVRSIAPAKVSAMEDPAGLALQMGFTVSGTNPIVGAHHFYPMLSRNGEDGYTFIAEKNSVTVGDLPKTFSVGDAQISLEGFENKTYRARVTRPFPQGERSLTSGGPTRTIFITIPR
ncbi:MAG TPA: hypothetical protein VF548_10105 [Allosphingosinicella sp.]|jgi:hypothetical protein